MEPICYDDPLKEIRFPNWICKDDIIRGDVPFYVTSRHTTKLFFYNTNQHIRYDMFENETIFEQGQRLNFDLKVIDTRTWKDLNIDSHTVEDICLFNELGKELWKCWTSEYCLFQYIIEIGISINGIKMKYWTCFDHENLEKKFQETMLNIQIYDYQDAFMLEIVLMK